jgi:hypothetical protein
MAQYDDDLMHALRDVLDEEADLLHIGSGARTDLAVRLARATAVQVDLEGQRNRHLVFTKEGNPHCSHCGAMGCNRTGERPNPPPGHFQYGITCTCTEPTPHLPAREPAGTTP